MKKFLSVLFVMCFMLVSSSVMAAETKVATPAPVVKTAPVKAEKKKVVKVKKVKKVKKATVAPEVKK